MKIGTIAYLLERKTSTPTIRSNTTQKTQSNISTTRGAAELVATQEGPESAQPGENLVITCKIRNVGSEPAEDITVTSQLFEEHIKRIDPGEEIEFNVNAYIPTLEEVKEGLDPNATLSEPFCIGGCAVIYYDINGRHEIRSNPIEIKLI